jgi:hypothetical protein
VIIGAGAAVTQGLLSQESAVAIIVFVAGRLGVQIDGEEELRRVREMGNSPDSYGYNGFDVPGMNGNGGAV